MSTSTGAYSSCHSTHTYTRGSCVRVRIPTPAPVPIQTSKLQLLEKPLIPALPVPQPQPQPQAMFGLLPHLQFELAASLVLRLRRIGLRLRLCLQHLTGLKHGRFPRTQLPDVLMYVLLLARGALEEKLLGEGGARRRLLLVLVRVWEPEGGEAAFGRVGGLVDARLFLVGVVQVGVFGGGVHGVGAAAASVVH